MQDPTVNPKQRVFVMDSGRVRLGTLQAPLKAKHLPERAAGAGNPRPQFQPVAERFPALEEQEIVLTLFAPEAREVTIAGSFNSWCPDATPMKRSGAGNWVVRLMLRSGQYEYRFVVDGLWSREPDASQRLDRPNGEPNSVLLVPLEVRTSIL
jgi:hypothetical protein